MNKILLLIFTLFSLSFADINESKKIEPKVGIFVTSLHNLSITNSSFDVIFWTWFIHNSDKYKPYATTEVTNLKDIQSYYQLENKVKTSRRSQNTIKNKKKGSISNSKFILSSSEKRGDNWIWNTQKFKATILNNWNLKNYPFDRHELKIKIEDAYFDYTDLKFIPDIENSKISQDLKIDGWSIKNLTLEEKEHLIETTFGDPSLNNGKSSYSELITTIYIQRDGLRDFVNIFIPIYLAFFISWLGYFIRGKHEMKVSLFLASIFMLIGNKYVIDSNMPTTSVITLVDKVQILTFITVTLFIFIVSISMFFNNRKREKAEKRLNIISMLSITIFYIAGNIYLFKDVF